MNTHRDRYICSAVLALLLLLVSTTGAGALQLLPGDGAIAPAAGAQTAPAIAQGGDLMLAVWADDRANVTGGLEGETSKDIYGVRFDAEGNLLDAVPIAITAARSAQENPKVVWNGSNWLVIFETYELGGAGYSAQKSLAAVRVAPSGQVLDAKPIPLNGLMVLGSTFWAAASDGVNWVVVNKGNSASGDIVAMRISSAGIVLDPPTRAVWKTSNYGPSNLKLAYAGGTFLLTFDGVYTTNGVYDTRAVRFNGSLALLDAAPLALLDSQLSGLAGNGNAFYIIWTRQNADYSVNIAGARVSTAGLKLDGSGVNLSGTKTPYAYAPPAVVWDGVNWRVTWGEIGTTYTARVNASGQVLDPGSVALPGLQTGPIAGNGAGGAQLAWSTSTDSNYDVFSGTIAANNTAGASHAISLGAPRQIVTDIATNGNGYMVVYQSSISSVKRVLAQPLDAAGNPLTGEPIQLDTGSYSRGPGAPNIAWNGSVYLAAWGNSSGIVAQRLLPSGDMVDPAPFVVMTNAFGAADVAAIGDTFLVTGRQIGQTPEIILAIGARVRGSDGAVLDNTPLTLGGFYVSRSPAVTALGGRFLVAFISNISHDSNTAATSAVFVSTTGASVVSTGTLFGLSTGSGNGIVDLGLGSSDTTALVVQPMYTYNPTKDNDLVARLIQADGTVGPSINLTPWTGNQYKPRVAWDGANFIIAYQDQKNRLAEQSLEQLDARSDLFAMRVTPTGAIVDPQGFVFSALPTGETDPSVASRNGVTLLAGSLMLNDATFANYRIVYEQRDATVNKWPIAVASATPAGNDLPLTVSFSSTGSVDMDGWIAAYNWNFGDGTTSEGANPSHTYTTSEPFVATLTITDNDDATAVQAVLVKTASPNQPPVAVARAVPMSGPAPLDVIFYADGSYDPDGIGLLANIRWTFSDGGEYWGSTAYHTFYGAGTYTATLTVYDSRGATGTTSLTIKVGGANQPPVANVSATPTSGTAPLAVNFSSAGSSDPDGAIVSYSWNFGDGGTSTAANPSHMYAGAGAYTATLIVTDNAGSTASKSVAITVTATANVLRSTNITLTATRQFNTVTATGKVTVKNQANAIIQGATVSATWTLPNGTTRSQTATTNSSGIATFSVKSNRGTYRLTVTNITRTGYVFDRANSVLTKSITK